MRGVHKVEEINMRSHSSRVHSSEIDEVRRTVRELEMESDEVSEHTGRYSGHMSFQMQLSFREQESRNLRHHQAYLLEKLLRDTPNQDQYLENPKSP